MDSFISKLIDWKDFEIFVADLYRDAENVTVDHNVTEKGKSGANRQIDVRLLQKTKLHTYKTIIECKRWKEPVDRQVIDVLAASVEDLRADKGAIFTTKGFEAGAEQYAKAKGIDLFLIRDIYEEEWAEPGRVFSFYLQGFHSTLKEFSAEGAKMLLLPGITPGRLQLNFDLKFQEDQQYPESLQLYALGSPEVKGPHLLKMIIILRDELLANAAHDYPCLLDPEDGTPEVYSKRKIRLDFTNYPYRFFKVDDTFMTFDYFLFDLYDAIYQNKMTFDRTALSDLALMVENYVTRQKNIAHKRKADGKVVLSEPVTPTIADPTVKVIKNGAIARYTMSVYVDMPLKPDTIFIPLPEMTVNLGTLGATLATP